MASSLLTAASTVRRAADRRSRRSGACRRDRVGRPRHRTAIPLIAAVLLVAACSSPELVLRVEVNTLRQIEWAEPVIVAADGIALPRVEPNLWVYEATFDSEASATAALPIEFSCQSGGIGCGQVTLTLIGCETDRVGTLTLAEFRIAVTENGAGFSGGQCHGVDGSYGWIASQAARW